MRALWLIVICMCVPLAAYAAASFSEQAGTARFWAAAAAVQVLSLFGYAGSALPDWAQWVDDTGGLVAIAERRLKILKGMVLAFLAGNVAYFGGYYLAGAPEIACFIAAAVAAYGGDKFLAPVLGRITGKAAGT